MDWVSSWIQGIIIAVIISTIIEMILPEGTSKKYIKVVIGVYILFTIVSPVISKITSQNFRVSDIFDIDEYIEASSNSSTLQNQLSEQNESQIREVYLSSIKNDIKEKIENKGYIVNSLDVEIENDEQYTLKKISLQISQGTTENDNTETNSINKTVEPVNEVKIEVGTKNDTIVNSESSLSANTNNSTETSNLDGTNQTEDISNQDKKELKEYLSSVYEISKKNIFINE